MQLHLNIMETLIQQTEYNFRYVLRIDTILHRHSHDYVRAKKITAEVR